MDIGYGDGKTEFGPGVQINLSGDEVATAIVAYLVAHGVHIAGPRTVTVRGQLCGYGGVYVDPCGFVVHNGYRFEGRGKPVNKEV